MKIPSKEQILKAAETCPDSKAVLRELFPDVFKGKGWEDITDICVIRKSVDYEGKFYLQKNEHLVCWVDINIIKPDVGKEVKVENGCILMRKKC